MPKDTETLVTARELEQQIFNREGICVILRCPSNTMLPPWPWKAAARDKFTLARLRDERLAPHLGKIDFMILKTPVEEITNTGWWKLSNLRQIVKDAIKALRAD